MMCKSVQAASEILFKYNLLDFINGGFPAAPVALPCRVFVGTYRHLICENIEKISFCP
jgi:hypothetical protein